MLHRVLKREGITTDNIDWFVNMVKLGTYKIPELQTEYAKLKDEVEAIDYKKTMAKHALEEMNNQITSYVESYINYLQLAVIKEMSLHIYNLEFKY
jgi:predicted transcriptional regulator